MTRPIIKAHLPTVARFIMPSFGKKKEQVNIDADCLKR
jgi:hypothetical protein